jgi:two-component system, sensor histidine kinase and response regulator
MLDFEISCELSGDVIAQFFQAFEEMISPLNALWIRERLACDLVATSTATRWEEFTLFLSEKFNVLVLIGAKSSATSHPRQGIQIGLTFETEAIASFCAQLSSLSDLSSDRITEIETACRNLQPNDGKIQSQFTLRLLELISSERAIPQSGFAERIAPETSPLSDESEYSFVSVCQPIENALQQQIKQEKLLYQVTTQIRQSLELPVILSTAVEAVRRCLEVDRLLIYEFDQNSQQEKLANSQKNNTEAILENQPQLNTCCGCTTYESRKSPEIPSILELELQDDLAAYLELKNLAVNQFPVANHNINNVELNQENILNFIQIARIKSELLLPIVVEEKLWGLLIAHQCSTMREWQENDRRFLRDIADHLAIAISQALLYQQLQQHKQILEERFQNQNQDLRDALIAAEAASRSKSEFLAAMSHELRTPLTCVIGMSSTLLRWSFGQLSEKQRHYLKTIHDSGEHLLELINDILELSQLEAGNAVLNLQEISLVQLADQILLKMAEKASNGEISLQRDFQLNPEEDRLIADARRIKQIFYNLLSNAIKFTPPGGQVTVRFWRENHKVILQVEDTGVGISPEHKPLIFNKFQQLDSSYHRRYEGTGLGLALTKQLVELHGGWINVTSEVGVGSIFTVELPIKKINHPPSTPVTETIPNQNGLSRIVLIAEDEETATKVCDLLTHAGYQVVWIVDALNALLNIEVLQPKLVIIETPLSDIQGSELIEDLRKKYSTSLLKILVLMTNYLISKDLSIFWEAGADDYLVKPLKNEVLLNKIQGLFTPS